jgi:hypothetical protein
MRTTSWESSVFDVEGLKFGGSFTGINLGKVTQDVSNVASFAIGTAWKIIKAMAGQLEWTSLASLFVSPKKVTCFEILILTYERLMQWEGRGERRAAALNYYSNRS